MNVGSAVGFTLSTVVGAPVDGVIVLTTMGNPVGLNFKGALVRVVVGTRLGSKVDSMVG